MTLVSYKSFGSTNWHSNKHISCIRCNDNSTNQITDSSTLQFICRLSIFMHIINMQSNGASITLYVSGHTHTCGYPATSISSRISTVWVWYIPHLDKCQPEPALSTVHVVHRRVNLLIAASWRFTVLLHTYLTICSNAAVCKADVNKDGGG